MSQQITAHELMQNFFSGAVASSACKPDEMVTAMVTGLASLCLASENPHVMMGAVVATLATTVEDRIDDTANIRNADMTNVEPFVRRPE